jgi:transposase
MSKALSVDLRERVVRAVAAGVSCRSAAARFGVSAPSAIRRCARLREQGSIVPGPLGGDRRSERIEAHAALILHQVEHTPDITLGEFQAILAGAGVAAGITTLWRFLRRRQITLKKKSVHAAEQARADVLKRRWAWFEHQLDLDPEQLIFIDETWTSIKMARSHDRAPRGQRLRAAIPTATGRPPVRSQGVVLQSSSPPGRTRYGPGSSRLRHDDRGSASRDPGW